MFVKTHVSCIICLFVSLLLIQIDSTNQKWMNDLANCIQRDFQSYQIMLVTNEEANHNYPNAIFKELAQKIPTIILTYRESNFTNKEIQEKYFSLRNPRGTTLFVLIMSGESAPQNSDLYNFMNLPSALSGVNTRPKCLVLFFKDEKSSGYEKILQDLWSQRFLDITIIEHIQNPSSSKFYEDRLETPTIHYYNPFNNSYVTTKLSSNSHIFPDKLRNFHGFNITIGTIANFTNSSLLLQAFSKTMNFTVADVSMEFGHDETKCGKNDSTFLVRELVEGRVQFIANLLNYRHICNVNQIQFAISQSIGISYSCAVVPRIPASDAVGVTHKNYFYVFLSFIIIVSTMRLLSYLLKFDACIWRTINIFQLILGFSVSNEPRKWPERIVFICLLFASMVYSNYIWSMLTSIAVQKKSELKIKTLEDLYDANLTILVPNDTYDQWLHDLPQNLKKKLVALPNEQKYLDCFNSLPLNKTVACVMNTFRATKLLLDYENEHKRIDMKIVRESVHQKSKLWIFAPSSPYIERIDEIIRKLLQCGLIKKWKLNSDEIVPNFKEEQGNESGKNIPYILVYMVLFGYTVSCFVFAIELFLDRLMQKLNYFWLLKYNQ